MSGTVTIGRDEYATLLQARKKVARYEDVNNWWLARHVATEGPLDGLPRHVWAWNTGEEPWNLFVDLDVEIREVGDPVYVLYDNVGADAVIVDVREATVEPLSRYKVKTDRDEFWAFDFEVHDPLPEGVMMGENDAPVMAQANDSDSQVVARQLQLVNEAWMLAHNRGWRLTHIWVDDDGEVEVSFRPKEGAGDGETVERGGRRSGPIKAGNDCDK